MLLRSEPMRGGAAFELIHKIAMTSDAQAVLQSWSAPLGVDAGSVSHCPDLLRGWFRLARWFPQPDFSVAAGSIFALESLQSGSQLAPPLEAFDDVSLSVHMVQHLLLMAIAPPLILLGAPALPLLQGLPQSMARSVVGPFLRWRLVKSVRTPCYQPCDLLARRHACFDRMACPCRV